MAIERGLVDKRGNLVERFLANVWHPSVVGWIADHEQQSVLGRIGFGGGGAKILFGGRRKRPLVGVEMHVVRRMVSRAASAIVCS